MKTFTTLGAALLATTLVGCTQEPATDDDVETPDEAIIEFGDAAENFADTLAETIDEDAPEADGSERFYGRKSFTIVSTQTGAESGDIIEHVREWGRLRAEVKDTEVGFGGFTQATKQRVIYDGSTIVTVDETTGSVTSTENPMYDSIVARMDGKSGVEVGKEMMGQLGGVETGETGRFAGVDCDYWEIEGLGSQTCITPWGGTLHMTTNFAGMSIERTAVEVRMNDGGPDSAFEFDASAVTETPSIDDIMRQMQGAQ